MTISSIIADLKGSERTLTVYDPTDETAVSSVERHFEVQNVEVREATAPEGPDDFAVLHDGDEFLAASELAELRRAVSFETGLVDATDLAETTTPDVLKHVSDATFTAYGKRRMILASREIEERAWRAGGGELHAGFQFLSLFREQWDLYGRIADRGVDVHAYGVPDWEPPTPEWLTVHDDDTDEIRDSWFVVLDAPDDRDCALVAEEREPNEFSGFWTYDEALVGDVLGHLRSAYS
ncbi:DICT sensory domain-containing protein [Halorussus caseinilyticus]|uniref:DICT sensory domain-containing protein n=1 Tax=Halorussus caseinilyticus TaxID=3034025 RepID=A0ABD5WED7_9EURY|nr:DICT sensory domain-containing protein [Halorussus sp. DT72]